jgi:hypothetical protein
MRVCARASKKIANNVIKAGQIAYEAAQIIYWLWIVRTPLPIKERVELICGSLSLGRFLMLQRKRGSRGAGAPFFDY